MFPGDLTSSRLYTLWARLRTEAGLNGMCIHDLRHSFAAQGMMNGVGLATVGRLLGHRRRATTAIYAHLDDAALRDAAAQVAAVIARPALSGPSKPVRGGVFGRLAGKPAATASGGSTQPVSTDRPDRACGPVKI